MSKKKDNIDIEEIVENNDIPDKKEKKNKQTLKILELETEVKNLQHKILTIHAEADNFKKRIDQARIQDRKYAALGFIENILDPIEQLINITNIKVDDPNVNNFLIGFKMIAEQFESALASEGITEIKALNEPFDPKYHQAIETAQDDTLPDGVNVAVMKKGYLYKDRLIRPAMVKVNQLSTEDKTSDEIIN